MDNQNSQTQLFSWILSILAAALNIPTSDVQSVALQAYIPSDYTSPEDNAKLQTAYIVYVPASSVSSLESQPQTPTSAFHTALGSPYRDLATHVDPDFDITNPSASSTPSDGPTALASDVGC